MAEKIEEKGLKDGEIAEIEVMAGGAVEIEGDAQDASSGGEPARDPKQMRIVKVRPTLTGMEVGDEVKFPVMQLKSVRAQASELGLILDRRYQTRVDKEARTVAVTRTA